MPSDSPKPMLDYATRSRQCAWLPLLVVTITLGLLGSGLYLFLSPRPRSYGPSPRGVCASNMKQIGQAFLLYSNENQNRYPPDLATAWATQDLNGDAFICRMGYSQSMRAATRFTCDVAARTAHHLDYVYVGEGLTSDVKADEPTLFERLADHNQEGGLVLFGDGRVEWIDKPQILKLLEPLRNTPRLTEEEYNAIVAK